MVHQLRDSHADKSQFKEVVHKLESLPTLPQIATQILRMFTEGEPELDEVIKLIQTDQALTMKILKLVNSAYYRISSPVTSIQNAVMRLGFNEIRSALLSVTVSESLIKSLGQSGVKGQTDLWKHSLACAIGAEMIAAQIYPQCKGELFVSGLLHDVGRLILAECFPEKVEATYQANTARGAPLIEAENQIIGVDHTTVGKWLAEKWNLPELFVHAIWLHHHPLEAINDLDFIKHKKTILIVRLADILVHRIMADSLTFNYDCDDFEALREHLGVQPAFCEKFANSLGKYYSEWTSILGFQEDEISFYCQALQRANHTLGSLVSENARHEALQKVNEALNILHDLHLEIAPVEQSESVIELVARTVWLKLRKPEGALYYHDRPGKRLIGRFWSTERELEPFSLSLDDTERPKQPATAALPEAVMRLIMTRHDRVQRLDFPVHEATLLQHSKPYLVVPLIQVGGGEGEIALVDEIGAEIEPLTRHKLKILGYLASITGAALSRVALIEEIKGSAESLSTALAKNHQMMLILKKSNEEFEHLFEYSNDAIVLHHADGAVTRVNQRAEELLGYTKTELKTNGVLQQLFQEIRKTSPHDLLPAGSNGKGLLIETRLRHKNGSIIDVALSSRMSDPKSGLIQSLIRDITRQKLTAQALWAEKERLSVTLRSIGDGVITTDTKGAITLINAVGEQLTGWGQDESVGKSLPEVLKIVNEKSRRPVENLIMKVLETGKPSQLSRHVLLIHRDGIERLITDSAAPLIDREGTIIGGVMVIRDITEKQKLEQEFLKAQKFESLGILAGGIAHDFNNILTAIAGSITLAKMYAKPGEKTIEKLTQAEKACQRAKDLTRQLSTFSKGGLPEKKTASIAELIKDSVSFALRGSNVRCEYVIAHDLWPADVDPGQISQVLNNLIINADQAMAGGGTITVSAENHVHDDDGAMPLDPGDYVRITVRDQGCGISPEDLSKIFDPYFTTKSNGNGLGLATAYSIMKKHEGYISVESLLGKGTALFLYLPSARKQTLIRNPENEKTFVGSGNVLLMDDEKEIRDTTGEMLESIGYQVAFAKDGVEAVDFYRQAREKSKPFDVVIIDLTVPGSMGGKETIQELLKIDPAVKAIISSGYPTDPVLAEFEKHGFRDFLIKPYQIGALSRVLHSLTNGKH